MGKVALIAKLVAQDGKRDELLAALKGLSAQVEDEPGTEVYVINADAADQNTVWSFEVYADQAALGAHGSSDAMKAAGAQFATLLAAPLEISFLEPLTAKGVSL